MAVPTAPLAVLTYDTITTLSPVKYQQYKTERCLREVSVLMSHKAPQLRVWNYCSKSCDQNYLGNRNISHLVLSPSFPYKGNDTRITRPNYAARSLSWGIFRLLSNIGASPSRKPRSRDLSEGASRGYILLVWLTKFSSLIHYAISHSKIPYLFTC